MLTFSIVLVALGVLLLLLAAWFFILYRLFNHSKTLTSKTMAFLVKVKHRKNVPVYGQRTLRGPIAWIDTLKNVSRGTYQYSVKQKTYTIRYTERVTARQMPETIRVVYCKRLPQIAYVHIGDHSCCYDVYATSLALIGGVFVLLGGIYYLSWVGIL